MHGQGLPPKYSKKPYNQYHHSSHTRRSDTAVRLNVREVFIGQGVDQRHKKVNSGQAKRVLYSRFPQLSSHNQLVHAVFTRQGGVSKAPYDTLNTSYNTGDKPQCVGRNLQIIKEAIGAKHLVFMNQMHGKDILILRQDEFEEFREPADVDALITDIPQLALMVTQADCQGVILFDRTKGVVSNVHCGWRGNAHNILGPVVGRMRSEFGCRETDLMAAIGPSLGPCCAKFTDYKQVFPEKFRRFMVREGYFDLWEISRWQLLGAGLKRENIEVAGVCTRCKTDMFYSYRAEGTTGRFATVAMLKGKQSAHRSSR